MAQNRTAALGLLLAPAREFVPDDFDVIEWGGSGRTAVVIHWRRYLDTPTRHIRSQTRLRTPLCVRRQVEGKPPLNGN